VTELAHPGGIAQEVDVFLGGLERRLLSVIHSGARGAREIDSVLSELAPLTRELRQSYARLHETLERRDLAFETVAQLEHVRKHCLWLYRKCRLEQCFFAKLRFERSLRDVIYKQIVETNQEISAIEETERELRKSREDSLARDLLQGLGSMGPAVPH
jgi:hypothetical protein